MRRRSVIAILLVVPLPAGVAAEAGTPLERAMGFLASQQADDGGYHPFLAPYVGEAVAAMGLDPKAWPDPSAPLFPSFQPYAYGGDADRLLYSYERIAHAVASAGYDAYDVNGRDMVALIQATFRDGQFGRVEWVNDDAWAIIALRAAGVPHSDPQIQAAAAFIELARCQDGGWSYAVAPRHEKPGAFSPVSSTDVTGMAISALHAAGRDVAEDVRARQLLDATYDEATGGHRDQVVGGLGVTAASTVWALQAYRAMGLPDRPASLGFVRGLQAEDGGFRNGPTASPDVMTTADVVVLLAGAGYPVASRSGAVTSSVGPALEPSLFTITGAFTRVVWRFGDGGEATGKRVHHTFASAGPATYAVKAEGPGLRLREAGTLNVPTARPTVALPPDVEALRRVPVVLQPEASDPDGAVVGFEVDWGDGTTGFTLEHAYDAPGDRLVTVRARDDAGAWSAPARATVHVRNRAPVLEGLPTALVTDRTRDVALDASALDADGDAVSVSWSVGNETLEGARLVHRFSELGNATVAVLARDPFGGEARAEVAVRVVNLPPRLANLTLPARAAAGEAFRFAVEAVDPDGPAPEVTWSFNATLATGTTGEATLPPGEHDFLVVARDADGGEATVATRLVVGEHEPDPTPVRVAAAIEDAPPPATEPSPAPLAPPAFLHPPRGVVAGSAARFSLAPHDEATAFRVDLGDGNATAWGRGLVFEHAWARPGAFELRADAQAPDGRTSSARLVVQVAAPPRAAETRADAVAASSRDAPRADDEDAGLADAKLEATALVTPEERRASPAWPAAPALALLLGALGRRARRA